MNNAQRSPLFLTAPAARLAALLSDRSLYVSLRFTQKLPEDLSFKQNTILHSALILPSLGSFYSPRISPFEATGTRLSLVCGSTWSPVQTREAHDGRACCWDRISITLLVERPVGTSLPCSRCRQHLPVRCRGCGMAELSPHHAARCRHYFPASLFSQPRYHFPWCCHNNWR